WPLDYLRSTLAAASAWPSASRDRLLELHGAATDHGAEHRERLAAVVLLALALLRTALVAAADARERHRHVRGAGDAVVEPRPVEELHRAAPARGDRARDTALNLRPRVRDLLVEHGRVDLERPLAQRDLDEVPVLRWLAVLVDAGHLPPVPDRPGQND